MFDYCQSFLCLSEVKSSIRTATYFIWFPTFSKTICTHSTFIVNFITVCFSRTISAFYARLFHPFCQFQTYFTLFIFIISTFLMFLKNFELIFQIINTYLEHVVFTSRIVALSRLIFLIFKAFNA